MYNKIADEKTDLYFTNNLGMSIEEIRVAVDIGKPVVAVKITDSTSSRISELNTPVIPKRKDSLGTWITLNV